MSKKFIEFKREKNHSKSGISCDELDNLIDEIKVDLVDVNIENKCLFFKKGEIYPTLKINDILEVSELYLGYDDFYCIKLYISAKISEKEQVNTNKNNLKKVLFYWK